MNSAFVVLPEDKMLTEKWQTTQLDRVQGDWDRLAQVTAVVVASFVDDQWVLRRNEGSLTIQNVRDSHEVITIFIDKDNGLARKEGLALDPDPIVVAVELTHQPPFTRRLLRDDLERRFQYYLNPEKGRAKRWLAPTRKPDERHYFDIIFLERAPCELPTDEHIAMLIHQLISEGKPLQEVKVGSLYDDEFLQSLLR